MKIPDSRTIFSDPLEVGHPVMLLWEFCWRGAARSIHVGMTGGIAAIFVFPQTIPAYAIPAPLPHLMLFAMLVPILFGIVLGGAIGILLGVVTLFMSRHKFYKLTMIVVASTSAFMSCYLCLVAFFEQYSVNRALHLAFSLHSAMVAGLAAGYFGYQIATWRKKAKKKTKLITENIE